MTAALGVLAGACFGLALAWNFVASFGCGKALYVAHLRSQRHDSSDQERLQRLTALGERMRHLRAVPIALLVMAIVLVIVAAAS